MLPATSLDYQQTINELQTIHGMQRNNNNNLEENFKSLQQFNYSNAINANREYRRDSLDSKMSSSVVSEEPLYPNNMHAYVVHHKADTDFHSYPDPSNVANMTSPQTEVEKANISREPSNLKNISNNPPMWSKSNLVNLSETLNEKVHAPDSRTSSSSAVFYDSLDNVYPDRLLVNSDDSIETYINGRDSLQFIKNPSNVTLSIASNSSNSINEAAQMHRRYLQAHSLGFISTGSNGRLLY